MFTDLSPPRELLLAAHWPQKNVLIGPEERLFSVDNPTEIAHGFPVAKVENKQTPIEYLMEVDCILPKVKIKNSFFFSFLLHRGPICVFWVTNKLQVKKMNDPSKLKPHHYIPTRIVQFRNLTKVSSNKVRYFRFHSKGYTTAGFRFFFGFSYTTFTTGCRLGIIAAAF